MAQCEYTRYDDKRCTETARTGQSLCILHDKASDKDAAEFLTALKAKVAGRSRTTRRRKST